MKCEIVLNEEADKEKYPYLIKFTDMPNHHIIRATSYYRLGQLIQEYKDFMFSRQK